MFNIFSALTIGEILLNILSQIITILLYFKFIKVTIIHKNMVKLVTTLMCYYIFTQNMRLINAIKELTIDENAFEINNTSINYLILTKTDSYLWVDLLRICGLICQLGCMITVIYERIYATIRLKTYEKSVSNLFFIFCLFYQILPAIGHTYTIYKEIIGLSFCGGTVLIFNILFYLIFNFLEWFNKKQYRLSLNQTTKYTLSERFQLQENIRTSLIVKRFAAIIFFLNLFIAIALLISHFFSSNFVKHIVYIIFNYSFNFYGFAFATVAMITCKNGTNRKIFFNPLKCIKRIYGSRQVHPTVMQKYMHSKNKNKNNSKNLRSFNGNQLIFTAEEETELYFQQLQIWWKE